MTTPLIDDELVEMVARAMCPKDARGNLVKSRMPSAMYDARAALAVAVPVIVERCAAEAESHRLGEKLIRHKMSETDQVAVVSETIARAIRSLTGAKP